MTSLVQTLPGATEVRSCTAQEFGKEFHSDEATFPNKCVFEITNIEQGVLSELSQLKQGGDKDKVLVAIGKVFEAILKPYNASLVYLATEGGYDWNVDNSGTFSIMSVDAPFHLKIARSAVTEGKPEAKQEAKTA